MVSPSVWFHDLNRCAWFETVWKDGGHAALWTADDFGWRARALAQCPTSYMRSCDSKTNKNVVINYIYFENEYILQLHFFVNNKKKLCAREIIDRAIEALFIIAIRNNFCIDFLGINWIVI